MCVGVCVWEREKVRESLMDRKLEWVLSPEILRVHTHTHRMVMAVCVCVCGICSSKPPLFAASLCVSGVGLNVWRSFLKLWNTVRSDLHVYRASSIHQSSFHPSILLSSPVWRCHWRRGGEEQKTIVQYTHTHTLVLADKTISIFIVMIFSDRDYAKGIKSDQTG